MEQKASDAVEAARGFPRPPPGSRVFDPKAVIPARSAHPPMDLILPEPPPGLERFDLTRYGEDRAPSKQAAELKQQIKAFTE